MAVRPADRYGPSALLTPANLVSIVRLVISPVFFLLILRDPTSWLAVGCWVVLASTDFVDGNLARRFGTTRSGAFLDPLADKVLVLGALFVLAASGRFPWVPVVLIAARELYISLYRTRLGRQGLAVPARTSAKVKTVLQEIAVGIALAPIAFVHPVLSHTFLWVSVVLTLYTGAQYLLDGRSAATTLGHR
jgi:CDP-diacylglycerol--glycerol-3-phosphate 3-phosphatidyltransferase